jgi:group I intron endonuclease
MKNENSIVTYADITEQMQSIILENKGKSGVYLFTNKVNGKRYVGSSENLGRRLSTYFSINYLQTVSEKGGSIIHKALLKHGYSNFSLDIIEYCKDSEVIAREQYYLDKLNPEYNILKTAGSSLGYKHSKEAIEKIKAAGVGRIFTEEAREKQRAAALRRIDKIRTSIILANGHPVEVKNIESGEIQEYPSIFQAAKGLKAGEKTIKAYILSQKTFRGQYLLSKKSKKK